MGYKDAPKPPKTAAEQLGALLGLAIITAVAAIVLLFLAGAVVAVYHFIF